MRCPHRWRKGGGQKNTPDMQTNSTYIFLRAGHKTKKLCERHVWRPPNCYSRLKRQLNKAPKFPPMRHPQSPPHSSVMPLWLSVSLRKEFGISWEYPSLSRSYRSTITYFISPQFCITSRQRQLAGQASKTVNDSEKTKVRSLS